MKKKPLLLLLTISIVLYFFVACSEDFPKDEILGNWQAHRFHYFNPDTIFAIELPIHDSLISSINDSTVDTITTRFGWYKLSLYEDLTLFSEELTGDTSNGFWERLSLENVRVWVNGSSLDWQKVDQDNYFYDEFFENQKIKRVFWERIN